MIAVHIATIMTTNTTPTPAQKISSGKPQMRRFSVTTGDCDTFVGNFVTLVTVKSCTRPSSRLMMAKSTDGRVQAGIGNETDTITLMPGDAKVANLRLVLPGAGVTSALARFTSILSDGTL